MPVAYIFYYYENVITMTGCINCTHTTLFHVSSVVDVESNVDEKTGGRPLDGGGMSKKIIF